MRSDAARNRQRILEVARRLLAEQGLEASMADIAEAAGVGTGTVYRRFPERGDLVRAVFEDGIDQVAALADKALAAEEPWDALVGFFTSVLTMEVTDLGLSELLDNEELRRSLIGRSDGIRRAIATLVRRAQGVGKLRSDVGPGDLAVLHRMLVEAARATRDVDADHWRRMLVLAFDGLRAPATTDLPGRPISVERLLESPGWRAAKARRR